MTITEEQRDELVRRASEVRRHAYAPYSHYAVGAAVLTPSGKIYSGVNVENAAYPNGICAERAAIFNAVGEGEREIVAVAVATENAGTPCGSCRQVMSEFGPQALVLLIDVAGDIRTELSVADLLPRAFGPDRLPRKG
jgi:cytidine deaminase